MVKKYHPDLNKSQAAAQIFADINEAHETLSNEVKREIYDTTGLTANEQSNRKYSKEDESTKQWTWKEAFYAVFYIKQPPIDNRPIEDIAEEHCEYFKIDSDKIYKVSKDQ